MSFHVTTKDVYIYSCRLPKQLLIFCLGSLFVLMCWFSTWSAWEVETYAGRPNENGFVGTLKLFVAPVKVCVDLTQWGEVCNIIPLLSLSLLYI